MVFVELNVKTNKVIFTVTHGEYEAILLLGKCIIYKS
jgi:hypothetical protein